MSNTPRPWPWFTVGPLCLTAYGVIRLTDPAHGPGFAWSLGHLALLAAVVAFVPALWRLRRWAAADRGPAARVFAGAAAAAGLLGAAAVTAQAVIDLVVGFLCADRAAMDVMFDGVRSHPGVTPAVYTVGPLLFHVGIVLLTSQLAAQRRIAARRPLLVVAGIAVTAADLDLMPLGGLLLLLALAPLDRQRPQGRQRPAPAPAQG
ncbi:hypothetical protein AB0953_23035 [Streptomyces sp. NPDC046866]|uniref:hypothetical protein n=1 Tax=Streptomyces sp. NPDC046866 TaxID=3154921 RepID=UPI0034561EEC